MKRTLIIAIALLSAPAFAQQKQDTTPAPEPKTAAECSVLQSSKVCDRLGFLTREKRIAPSGYYIQGRQ